MNPFSCPGCNAPASAAPTPQICGQCKLRFVLRAGARVDPTLQVPFPDPAGRTIKARSAGMLLMQSSVVAPAGVLQGSLDPITGLVPMDQAGIPYGDIISIAVWRKLDVMRLVVVSLLFLPLVLLALYGTVRYPPLIIGSGPLTALAAYIYYHLLGVKRNYARVFGSQRVLTLQFDQPLRRRRAFHDVMMRRAGIVEPSEIP